MSLKHGGFEFFDDDAARLKAAAAGAFVATPGPALDLTESGGLVAIRALLEAAPFEYRRTVHVGATNADGVGAAEGAVAEGGVQQYAYDLVVGEGPASALSDLTYDMEPSVAVVVYVPEDRAIDRLTQQDDVADLAEALARALLATHAVDLRLLGVPEINRFAKRNQWVLVLRFGMRFEFDLS